VYLNGGWRSEDLLALWAGTDYNLREFSNITVFEPLLPSDAESVAESAARLVTHFGPMNPDNTTEIINSLYAHRNAARNLLTNPDFSEITDDTLRGWEFSDVRARLVMEDGIRVLALSNSQGDERVNATQQLRLQPRAVYLFKFECRNTLADGAQKLYITFTKSNGERIAFPHGGGYRCPTNSGWYSSAIGFEAPSSEQAGSEVTIWLRNAGHGDAYFRNLSLIKVVGEP
jgi:hypothetical protein